MKSAGMKFHCFPYSVFPICGLLLLMGLALVSCRHAPSAPTPISTAQRTPLPTRQIAPDIKPEALWDARSFNPSVSLDSPKMVEASQADFLSDAEYVLGVAEHGESRAYPMRFMTFHHVVNDEVGTSRRGKIPVAITFCSNCNIGIRYDPRVSGTTLKFDFCGAYNGIATLYERRTQGVFLIGEGRIVTGPLTGTRLNTGPLLDTTWGAWKLLHPDTLVMSQDTPFRKFYGVPHVEGKRHQGGSVYSFFGATVTRGDKRLPPFDLVLAVTLTPQKEPEQEYKGRQSETLLYRAYPIQTLAQAGGVVNDILGDEPVGVLLDARTQTAAAFSRRIGMQTLTLEARGQVGGAAVFYDRETRTRWNVEGKGEDGPLKSKVLKRLDNHLSQWYAWAASFPNTSIYGRTDAPQPGNPFVEGSKNTTPH